MNWKNRYLKELWRYINYIGFISFLETFRIMKYWNKSKKENLIYVEDLTKNKKSGSLIKAFTKNSLHWVACGKSRVKQSSKIKHYEML